MELVGSGASLWMTRWLFHWRFHKCQHVLCIRQRIFKSPVLLSRGHIVNILKQIKKEWSQFEEFHKIFLCSNLKLTLLSLYLFQRIDFWSLDIVGGEWWLGGAGTWFLGLGEWTPPFTSFSSGSEPFRTRTGCLFSNPSADTTINQVGFIL